MPADVADPLSAAIQPGRADEMKDTPVVCARSPDVIEARPKAATVGRRWHLTRQPQQPTDTASTFGTPGCDAAGVAAVPADIAGVFKGNAMT